MKNNFSDFEVGDTHSPILIVDDSRTARAKVRQVLEAAGYAVVEAESGAEALKLVQEKPLSLITLDIEMPEVDGYQACEKLRALEKDVSGIEGMRTPIIFVTGNDTLDGRIKGFEAGACDFVTKAEIGKGELVEAVDRYLRPDREFANCRVLIVEDNLIVREMLRRVLGSLGIMTQLAEDGMVGYEILREHGEEFQMVILDNHMPRMTGVELCMKIRRELGLKTLPVLFLSGSTERESQIEFFRYGATDYLNKPFIREELVARMRVHLNVSRRARQMDALNQELERSNASLGRFASVAAHDLKSPLHSMNMAVELIRHSCGDLKNDTIEDCLQRVSRSVTRMSSLISGLLAYSRVDGKSGKHEPVSLSEIIDGVAEDFSELIASMNAEIVVADLPVIKGQKTLMRQLFQNLIGNSLKYHREGVVPVIRVYAEAQKADDFEERVCIVIEDNGSGFSDEEAETIFEPFQRLADAVEIEGHGLGLATCTRIAKEHQGVLKAVGRKGEGARIFFSLPIERVVRQNQREEPLEQASSRA